MSAPEYFLKTLADFDQIPDDRLAACYEDLALWMLAKRAELPAGVEMRDRDTFHWIDDGQHDAHVKFYDEAGTVVDEGVFGVSFEPPNPSAS